MIKRMLITVTLALLLCAAAAGQEVSRRRAGDCVYVAYVVMPEHRGSERGIVAAYRINRYTLLRRRPGPKGTVILNFRGCRNR